MKLTIDRKLLVSALATVKSVAASKPSLPILANVEINAFEKSVKFTCSNLDQTLQTKCEATVSESGRTTVRASLLCDLARSFVGDSVELRATKTKLDVRCGQSFFTLGTLDATEFPAIPRLKDPVEVTLAQHMLREALGSTCFAASNEESRYVLNGSYVHVNGQLTVASTDGRRLAERQTELDAKSAEALAIVPTASVNELMRLLRDDDDKNVTLQIAKNMAQFSFDDTVLYTKLIEGAYPNYRQVIPAIEGKSGVPISRTDLLAALQRIAFLSDTCELQFSKQLLTIRGTGKGDLIGSAQETLMIPPADEHTARFNIRYLMDGLTAVEDDEVIFFGGPGSNLSLVKVASKPWLCVIAGLAEEKEKEKPAKPAEKSTETKK